MDKDAIANELAQATAEHLIANGFGVIRKGIVAEDIGTAVHVGRSGAHSRVRSLGYAASNEGLLRNLIEVWLDPHRSGVTQELADAMKQSVVDDPHADPVDSIRMMCDLYFHEVRESNVAEVQLALWVGRNDPDTASKLTALYEHLDDIVADLFDVMLAHWSRTMRPPLTTRTLATAMSALVEGLVVRHRVHPESVPEEIFGTILLSLIPVVTQHVDDPPIDFSSVISPYTRPHRDQDPASTSRIKLQVMEEVTKQVRAGMPCRSIDSRSVAEALGMEPHIMEFMVGPPERVAAEEMRDMLSMLAQDGSTRLRAVEFLRTMANEQLGLVAFVASCGADLHSAPSTDETMLMLGRLVLGRQSATSSDDDSAGLRSVARVVTQAAIAGMTVDGLVALADSTAEVWGLSS